MGPNRSEALGVVPPPTQPPGPLGTVRLEHLYTYIFGLFSISYVDSFFAESNGKQWRIERLIH